LKPNWSSDTVDNDVVLVLTIVENNGVPFGLKLHRKPDQALNPV